MVALSSLFSLSLSLSLSRFLSLCHNIRHRCSLSVHTRPFSIHATGSSFPDELKGSGGFQAICCHPRPHPASRGLLCPPPRPCCVGTAQGALERPVRTLLAARRAASAHSAPRCRHSAFPLGFVLWKAFFPVCKHLAIAIN